MLALGLMRDSGGDFRILVDEGSWYLIKGHATIVLPRTENPSVAMFGLRHK